MYKRGGVFWFSINGVRQSSGTSNRKEAERLEAKLRQESWQRVSGFYVKSWDEACLEWLKSHKHLVSYPKNVIHAKWWTKHLRGLKVTAITKELVHTIIRRERPITLPRSKANNTANDYVNFVAKVIRNADAPVPRFTTYPTLGPSKRWLRREEWDALVSVMDDDLRQVCTFALVTGLREANVIGLRWDWIHGDAAYLPREVTKTAEDYGIPLSTMSQAIIAERRDSKVRHKDLVFTDNGKPWYKVRLLRRLYRAVDAAELEPMVFHTFRHTFASWLAQKGVADSVRERLGCWSGGGSSAARGYVHFDVESLRPFAELLSFDSHPKTQVAANTA